MQPLYQEIGERIKRIREQRHLSQQEVADSVGLTRTSVVNIEAGRQRLMVHQLCDFAKVLGTSMGSLASGWGAKDRPPPKINYELRALRRDLLKVINKYH